MKIEFLFNEIDDIQKLYQTEYVDNPLGGEKVPQYNYIGNDYLENRLQKLKLLPNIEKVDYQQSFARMANEVFVVIASGVYYEMLFTIDTYQYERARMRVSIERPGNIEASVSGTYTFPDGEEYDIFLEQLKIAVKDALKKDWAVCSWITDEQSEQLCSHLYPNIFKVENEIRAFANKILVHHLGKDWIKQFGMEKYEKSHKALSVDFKRNVPCFADIDDTFISMTMETMKEVMLEAKIYEKDVALEATDMADIHRKIADGAANSVLELIRSRRKVKIDIWQDVFKQYFSDGEDAKRSITDFIKNRNHVAHNKLLNWSGYQKMKQNIEELDLIIKGANFKFETSSPSEELYMTWNIGEDEADTEAAQRDWERNYLRLRIYGETGIDIRDDQGIYELFLQTLEELYNEFYDIYYFNPQFEMSEKFNIVMAEGEQKLFSIKSNACGKAVLDVVADMSFDDEMDGDSSLYLSCVQDGVELFSVVLQYHNGSGAEDNFEGKIVLNSESDYDTADLDDFKEELKEYIDENLNPMIAKKEALENEVTTSGDPNPVADIPCAECGEYGISIMEDFYPVGHCCYCGEENYIRRCDRCGRWYEDGDGNDSICGDCLQEILKE